MMAGPIALTAIPNALGRIVLRKNGRFISKEGYQKAYDAAAGMTRTMQRGTQNESWVRQLANRVREQVGPPIGGGNWESRVRQSGERFTEMLE